MCGHGTLALMTGLIARGYLDISQGATENVHLHTTANSVLKVDAYITKYELTGQYWTPLSKNAVVTFETMVLAPDGSQLGTLEGKIEVEQTGTSSIRRFRQELRDMVEEIVTDRVNDKLRKER